MAMTSCGGTGRHRFVHFQEVSATVELISCGEIVNDSGRTRSINKACHMKVLKHRGVDT